MGSFKILIRMSHYRFVLSKACHLPAELEHKAYWVMKELNFNATACKKRRLLVLNKINEFRLRLFLGKLKSKWYGPHSNSSIPTWSCGNQG